MDPFTKRMNQLREPAESMLTGDELPRFTGERTKPDSPFKDKRSQDEVMWWAHRGFRDFLVAQMDYWMHHSMGGRNRDARAMVKVLKKAMEENTSQIEFYHELVERRKTVEERLADADKSSVDTNQSQN